MAPIALPGSGGTLTSKLRFPFLIIYFRRDASTTAPSPMTAVEPVPLCRGGGAQFDILHKPHCPHDINHFTPYEVKINRL